MVDIRLTEGSEVLPYRVTHDVEFKEANFDVFLVDFFAEKKDLFSPTSASVTRVYAHDL